MISNISIMLIGILILTVNYTTLLLVFPCKKKLVITITIIVIYTIIVLIIFKLVKIDMSSFGGLPGLILLPIVIFMLKGDLFQKIFAFFVQYIITSFEVSFSQTIAKLFTKTSPNAPTIFYILLMLLLLISYLFFIIKLGRNLLKKLFENGKTSEWILYSLGAIFSFVILTTLRIIPNSIFHVILLQLFILWSFGLLCFAIINTYEKERQKSEKEFAKSIVSSGREHYQKINELYDNLRIIRHDFKFHIKTINDFVKNGDMEKLSYYLSKIDISLPENIPNQYCENSIVNALLFNYVEICKNNNINIEILTDIPNSLAIDDYDLCIILGNLLENSVEASLNITADRKINLEIKTQTKNLVIMIKNNFNGQILLKDGKIISQKNDGGFGLRSINAIIKRYGSEMFIEWDNTTFTTYLLLNF